jgi:hypothetical protein
MYSDDNLRENLYHWRGDVVGWKFNLQQIRLCTDHFYPASNGCFVITYKLKYAYSFKYAYSQYPYARLTLPLKKLVRG